MSTIHEGTPELTSLLPWRTVIAEFIMIANTKVEFLQNIEKDNMVGGQEINELI